MFDFSTLCGNHELFSTKTRKVIGKFTLQTPKRIWIDEFVCTRIKMYVFNCGRDVKENSKVFADLNRKISNLQI